MKALVKREARQGLWLEDAPKPTCKDDEVLIKVEKTAICGTDFHIYQWDSWAQKTIPYPMIIGHEFYGKIEAVGSLVKNSVVGERVTAEGHVICGNCRNCLTGRSHNCQSAKGLGVNRAGSFAEYVVVPASNIWHISDKISDEEAACFDPLGNAVHTALSFDLQGEDVLITGAGPIGLMGAQIAKFCGARNVVISDINPYRLKMAQDLGLHTVDASKQDIGEFGRSLGLKEGFDVGLEMSGNPLAFKDMIKNMVHGGKIASLGLFKESLLTDWNEIIFNGLTIKGVYGREMFETWYKMSALVEAGLDIKPIITHMLPYHEFQQAFDIISAGQAGKVVLDWTV